MNGISSSRWVDADRFFSCVPLVSWIVGVVNIIQMTKLQSTTIPLSGRYFRHIKNKSKEDLLFLFIPFIGNFILFLKYAKEKIECKEERGDIVQLLSIFNEQYELQEKHDPRQGYLVQFDVKENGIKVSLHPRGGKRNEKELLSGISNHRYLLSFVLRNSRKIP